MEACQRRSFRGRNAVLWVSGSFVLVCGRAPGQYGAAMAPLQPLGLPLAGFVLRGRGGIGLSLTGRRSDAAIVALDVLDRRLTQVLRHERGLSSGDQGPRVA